MELRQLGACGSLVAGQLEHYKLPRSEQSSQPGLRSLLALYWAPVKVLRVLVVVVLLELSLLETPLSKLARHPVLLTLKSS